MDAINFGFFFLSHVFIHSTYSIILVTLFVFNTVDIVKYKHGISVNIMCMNGYDFENFDMNIML